MIDVCVCGGRQYNDRQFVNNTLDELHRTKTIRIVMHGDAAGADHLAHDWAFNNDIPVMIFRANWAKYGKSAGPLRNGQMTKVGKPNIVIAFPGGRGTENMIKTAEQFCIDVQRVGEWV